ncbi:UNKNOWN [Stylonychia lemnae]|uniref:Uncharacterized protein n=1 Tax=Stylonychia lemnae TaxID=5949 RepID=A0A078AEC6_STYLE|nr:UNKNOWN [Stylonychia lemnae]|eukprot:CDW80555.1 UNKNOWN [Stylonychia lemnae]
MDIPAKVIKIQDFVKVLEYYKDYVLNPQALNSTKSELRQKLESYMNKRLVKLSKSSAKKPEKLQKIIDFLTMIDRDLPYQDFFKNTGLEVFPTIFKLTYYEQEYAVINDEQIDLQDSYLNLRIQTHEEVSQKLDQITHPQAKSNYLVNNLLAKMLFECDKQKLLIQTAEILYSTDKIISTQKVAKLLVYFGRLFQIVGNNRCKYLMGSLFAIGGLLKLEAKSYLHTINLRRGVELPCPLFNEENDYEKQEKQRVRELSNFDLHYFENDLIKIMSQFIKSISVPSYNSINNQIFDFYVDFSQDKFIDEYEEEEQNNPDKLYGIESAHYTINFLFDLVQFIFQFMITVEEYETKLEQEQMEVDSEQGRHQRNIFDHRKEIKPSELITLKHKYYFEGFDQVITQVVTQIKLVCPNWVHLLFFWHVKCADADSDKNWADVLEEARDCYDRQDNYNVFGLAAYLNLTIKQALGALNGTSKQINNEQAYSTLLTYESPYSSQFLFDCMQPLLRYCLKYQRSTTLNMIGLESLCFWTFINQTNQPIYENLGQFTRDEQSIQYILQSVFNMMGGQLSENGSKLSMKLIHQILKMYTTEGQIRIFTYIFSILDDEKNDRGTSVLMSQFYKNFTDSSVEIFKSYAESVKEVFELTLDCLKDETIYILDLTERIQASLNLFWYMITRERYYLKQGQITEAILSDSKYLDDVMRKKYFENLAKTIQAGLSGLDDDIKNIEETQKDQTAKEGMLVNVKSKQNSLNMLQVLLSQVSSLV